MLGRSSAFTMTCAIRSRLLSVAAARGRAPVPVRGLRAIEEDPAALVGRAGLESIKPIRLSELQQLREDPAEGA